MSDDDDNNLLAEFCHDLPPIVICVPTVGTGDPPGFL